MTPGIRPRAVPDLLPPALIPFLLPRFLPALCRGFVNGLSVIPPRAHSQTVLRPSGRTPRHDQTQCHLSAPFPPGAAGLPGESRLLPAPPAAEAQAPATA